MRTLRTLLVAAGLLVAAAAPAAASPPSSDHATNAKAAAAWLAAQVTPGGYVESAYVPGTPDISVTAQAVPAFVAAGVAGDKVAAALGYLGAHVEGFAFDGTADKPGALAYLALAAVAGGADPTAFGSPSTDLVARLLATLRTAGPDAGLFGSQSPTYDGAYRQGLAVLALAAAGRPVPVAALAWLEGQQCADGLWTAHRSDTTVACPAVNASTFSGPDTNSTALAVLALHAASRASSTPSSAAPAAGAAASAGASALRAVRNAGGGWGYLAASDQPTDANSTGVVASALLAQGGAADQRGLVALEGLQLGCDAAPADRGGVAFQPQGTSLFPDAMATTQAIPALAGAVLPVAAGTTTAGVPDVCAPAAASPAPTPAAPTAAAADGPAAVPASGAGAGGAVAATRALARTGAASGTLALLAAALVVAGMGLVGASDRLGARASRRAGSR